MRELVIATKNKGKLEEVEVLFKKVEDVKIKSLEEWPDIQEPEETGKTFAANARQKATYYAEKTGKICIADDSGLEVKALGGAPGIKSARYCGEHGKDDENNILLLNTMKLHTNRVCRFRCAIAVVEPNGKVLIETEGVCDGLLLHEPLGDQGFGYDSLFWSTEIHKGLGEATMEEKNKASHRSKAIKKVIEAWEKIK